MLGAISIPGGNEVYSLLALLADPEKYKQHLDALMDTERRAQQAVADQNDQARHAADDRKAAEDALYQAQTLAQTAADDRKALEAEVASQKAALLARETVLRANEEALQMERRDFSAYQAQEMDTLDKREGDVAEREAAVTEREATAKADERAAAEMRATWEAKMASLRALAGG